MSTFNFGEMYKKAEAEGAIQGYLDPGDYDVEFTKGGLTKTQGGKSRLTVWVKVISGPKAGGTDRIDQMIPTDDMKPGARGAFFGFVDRIGLSPAQLDQMGPDAAMKTVAGQRWKVTVSSREYNGKQYSDVKLVSRLGGDSAPSAVPAPAPAPAPASEPAPEPVAEAPAATAEPTVEELQAKLAALQTEAPNHTPEQPAEGSARPW